MSGFGCAELWSSGYVCLPLQRLLEAEQILCCQASKPRKCARLYLATLTWIGGGAPKIKTVLMGLPWGW